MSYKVTVDFDVCASTGSCMQFCPEVFEVRSDGFLYILQEEPPESLRGRRRQAADMCPTGAISVEGFLTFRRPDLGRRTALRPVWNLPQWVYLGTRDNFMPEDQTLLVVGRVITK